MGKSKAVAKQPLHKRSDHTSHHADAHAPATSWPPFRPSLPVTQLTFEAPIPTLEDQILCWNPPLSTCGEGALVNLLGYGSVNPLTQTSRGGEVVGLNPNPYGCGVELIQLPVFNIDVPSDDGFESIRAKTTWTALLYLTSAADGMLGGETVFYPHDRKSAREEIIIPPETGTLLLHKHGDNCLLHEGREVIAGQKWIIRTDLCIRR
ncbi:hypothetical protein FHL15_009082 [Xylaria flabelliformis]|uniref:Fe2OG dioxygenase domain-containing protein n=1 Tax=Xylaria flabelliformis TaxID=2512241 RepID=A0A553HPV1_9PEZI|nr:hypothetical protein FHL15_009082 [Xylaria flabelliformis]